MRGEEEEKSGAHGASGEDRGSVGVVHHGVRFDGVEHPGVADALEEDAVGLVVVVDVVAGIVARALPVLGIREAGPEVDGAVAVGRQNPVADGDVGWRCRPRRGRAVAWS